MVKEIQSKSNVTDKKVTKRSKKTRIKGTITIPYKDVQAHLRGGSNGKSQNKSDNIEK